MHNSSASCDTSTGNDAFNLPINMSNHNTILDEMFSHMTSVSPSQSNTFHPNSRKQIMAEFPGLSMLQGEPMNGAGFGISNHVGLLDCDTLIPGNAPVEINAVPRNVLERNAISDPSSVPRNVPLERNAVPRNVPERNTISDPSCPVSNTQVQEQLMGGVPNSASSLATILAARYGSSDNQKELGASGASVYTMENLKTLVSNDYSEALNSAFATSLNCGYDGMLVGVNNKWDSDKFVSCPELAMKVPGRTGGSQSFELMGNIIPNGWIPSDNPNVSSNVPSSSKFSNELSLSLAMCQPSIIHGTSIPNQNSELSCSGVHSLNERQLRLETSCNGKSISTSFSSCRPVQLAQFLSGSRYLHVIQEILAELASYSLENLVQMNYATRGIGAGTRLLPSSGHHSGRCNAMGGSDDPCDGDARFVVQKDLVRQQGREVEAKRKQLLALLQVVDDRYSQCLDEIHTVISAFHAATELDPRIHAQFALQTISFLYKNLRERISTQILELGANFNKGNTSEEDRSFQTSIQKQWALQQLRRKDHHLWRPQRGLPERSVSVLRAWMFQNFLHPYPKDAEKHLLAVRSGLTRSQVSNWFINARVRLWKPMIEEMCTEMNRRNGRMNEEERDGNWRSRESIESRRSNTNR